MPRLSRESWESIGHGLQPPHAPSPWRVFCDGLYQDWLNRQVSERKFARALKTDAFDEAVGPGAVPFLRKVADWSCEIDISAPTCRLAAARHPGLAVVAGDVRQPPLVAGAFDLAVSLSTLDHFHTVAEIDVALRSLHRLLRPGGWLLISLDNLSNPVIRLRNALPWNLLKKIGIVPYPVGATLRPGQLRGYLERAGFEVRDMTTLMHVPRAPAVALAALLEKAGAAWLGRLFCRVARPFEVLAKLPTACWTGNYIAATAVKPSHPNGASTLRS